MIEITFVTILNAYIQIHHEYIAIYMYEFMEYQEIKRIKIHIAVTI